MVSRDMQTSVIKALPLLLIGLALTPAGCVIATEYETIVGDIDEPVLIHGAHLVADGVIQIEARNVDTLAFDVLATTDATSHIAALGTDLYLYSYEDTIPAEYWTAGWGGAGARAELRIMAKVPGQADVPVDVVSDPDWGAC